MLRVIRFFIAGVALAGTMPLLAQAAAVPLPFNLGPVYGFGDYHAHQMGQLGFGGRLMYGSHDGAENVALKSCTGHNHAASWLPVAGTLMGQPDLGQHPLNNHGYGTSTSNRYRDWPTWINTTHQGYWKGWLYKAYQDGLRLFVMSAVNFDMFCSIMPQSNTNTEVLADLIRNPSDAGKQCDDMVNIKRQISAAHKFASENTWYEIALTPADARRIMNQGKMAVVLAVEASKIFGSKTDTYAEALSRLNALEAMGVRSFQLVHQVDNNLAGPAFFQVIFDIFNFIDNTFAGQGLHGFQKDSYKHNMLGMTAAGEQLVREMMRRKLIVDAAHLSERSFEKLYTISTQNSYYPIFVSHGHYRDIFNDKHADEKKLPHYAVRYVKATGGVIGLRTGADRVKTFTPGGIANNCDGSSRSFAQSYLLGTLGYGVKQGFGVDMTGMIAQMRPRFYDKTSKWTGNILYGGLPGINSPATWACGADNEGGDMDDQRAAQGTRSSGGINTDFDLIGFGHIGRAKEVIQDLNKIGVDTTVLENSGENFLQMWERIAATSRVKLADTVSAAGIDHKSYTDRCPGLLRRDQVDAYPEGVIPQPKGGGIPKFAPVCKAMPHFDIQKHNCSEYGFQSNGWCIQRRDSGKWYSARKLTDDLCPVPHSKISGLSYSSKIVCKNGLDGTIQRHNCQEAGLPVWNNYCIMEQNSYWVRVRTVVRDLCPLPYSYNRDYNGFIACRHPLDPRIKSKNCTGTIWGNYCVKSKASWWYQIWELK